MFLRRSLRSSKPSWLSTIGSTLLMGLALLPGCSDSPSDSAVLSVGVSADYAPFESSQQGELVGFDIDLARALGKKLGKDIRFHEMEFASIITSLQSGRLTLGISAIAQSPERSKALDFSTPYYTTHFAMVSQAVQPVQTLAELQGQRVGVQLGSTMETFAKEHKKTLALELHSVNTNSALIQELKCGRVRAVLLESSQAKAVVERHNDLTFADIPGDASGEFCVALAKNSPLLKDINDALVALKKEGFFEVLAQKWLNGAGAHSQ